MDRLRLTRSGKTLDDRDTRQRDVLPFPRGGVFGETAVKALDQVEGALSIARNLERTLGDMQLRLDELKEELDHPLAFPFADSAHDSRPFAA